MNREPPIPALVVGCAFLRGRKALLSCVRTLWADEGTCLLEIMNALGTETDVFEFGVWKALVRNGSRILDVDIQDQDFEGWHELLDSLMAQVVKNGAAFGFEAYLPQGDGN